MGRVIKMAASNPQTVKTNWTLLKFSLRTSKVPEGEIRLMKMSRPYAKTSEVDSSRAGDVIMRWTLAT